MKFLEKPLRNFRRELPRKIPGGIPDKISEGIPEEFLEKSWKNSPEEISGGFLEESGRNSWRNLIENPERILEEFLVESRTNFSGGTPEESWRIFFGESERNFFKNTGIDGTILDDSSWESGQNSWRHPIGIPVGILEKILEESRRKIWRNTGKMSGGFFMRNPERNLVGIPEDYHCGASEEFPEENLEKSWYNGG